MPATQHVGCHIVRRLDKVRALLIDDVHEVKFTPTEYCLILHFLEGKPVSDEELVCSMFHGKIDDDLWAREALDRHIDNIRRKLRQNHLKMRILRISGFGYILVSSSLAKTG